jgi:hypothetical protein
VAKVVHVDGKSGRGKESLCVLRMKKYLGRRDCKCRDSSRD